MQDNGFRFSFGPGSESSEAQWAAFVRAALQPEAHVPMMRVAFEDLIVTPAHVMRKIWDWLGLSAHSLDWIINLPPDPPPSETNRTATSHTCRQIERLHQELDA